jgi:hypothetical protein
VEIHAKDSTIVEEAGARTLGRSKRGTVQKYP